MLAARVALVTLAVAAGAWFALAAQAAHDQQQVTALVASGRPLTPSQAAAAQRQLDQAGTLNPDRGLDILRAEVVQHTGRIDLEVRILRRLVGAEPANIFAWGLLYFAAYRQPVVQAQALAHVRALAPPVPAAP